MDRAPRMKSAAGRRTAGARRQRVPDVLSLLGVLVAFGGLLIGQVLEGGHLSSLVQLAAFCIVVGGTVGAVMLQTPLKEFTRGARMVEWVFAPPRMDPLEVIAQITRWGNMARKEGLLALDSQLDLVHDPYTRRGLQMLVDGSEPDRIRESLEVDTAVFEQEMRDAARIWEAAGGYAPTLGILGAVMGLIHVMENLADPSKLGAGIAVAFVATVYGVGAANLIFLPIANKLKAVVARMVLLREMLADGLAGIAHGENPRLIEGRLQAYVT